MAKALTSEALEHNLELLIAMPKGAAIKLIADYNGVLYSPDTKWGRYHHLLNLLTFSSTRNRQHAMQATQLALEAMPSLVQQLSYFHRIISPSPALSLPIALDSILSYADFIRVMQKLQGLDAAAIDKIDNHAIQQALSALGDSDVVLAVNNLVGAMELSQKTLESNSNHIFVPPKAPIDRLSEELRNKDIIIETLQAQVDQLQQQPAPAPISIQEPISVEEVATKPAFFIEEEHTMLTSIMAQELRKLRALLKQMEERDSVVEAALPPPLELAREIGLAGTGRVPKASDEENIENVKKITERLLKLHEAWQAEITTLNQRIERVETTEPSSAKPKKVGWIEFDEAEVKELESTLGRVQLRNEQLASENEALKNELSRLKEGP